MSNIITDTEYVGNSPSGGTGGGGDASAANQALQLAQETLIAIRTDRLPAQESSRLPVILSAAQIVELQIIQATISNRNGTTSATQNAWTQVSAINLARKGFFLQNISDTTLEIGLGDSGAEFPIGRVLPNAPFAFDVVPPQRIAVRCPSATFKSYYASEA